MKRLVAVLAFCALGTTLFAVKSKTKYLCSISGQDNTYTTEFASRAECEALCFQKGAPAVCEETAAGTKHYPSELD